MALVEERTPRLGILNGGGLGETAFEMQNVQRGVAVSWVRACLRKEGTRRSIDKRSPASMDGEKSGDVYLAYS